MNGLDMAAIAIIGISFLAAVSKGLVSELVSLLSVIAGVYLAALFYPQAAELLVLLQVGETVAHFLGFLAIFITAVLAGAVLASVVQRGVQVLRLRWFDRLLGGAFGLLRGWLIVAVVFLAFASFPVQKRLVKEARTGEFFLESARVVIYMLPEGLKERFYEGYREIYDWWINHTWEPGKTQ
jgi:membrane protein required for colicin V production